MNYQKYENEIKTLVKKEMELEQYDIEDVCLVLELVEQSDFYNKYSIDRLRDKLDKSNVTIEKVQNIIKKVNRFIHEHIQNIDTTKTTDSYNKGWYIEEMRLDMSELTQLSNLL